MQNALRALTLSTLAGLSTLIGAFIIFVAKKKNEKMVAMSLGFAAGVMLSVSFTDLLPNAQQQMQSALSHRLGVLLSVLFLVVGIGIAAMIDHFVPHADFDATTGEKPHQNLYRTGLVSTLAIGLHNFPEGIATFMAGYENITLGLAIAIAITMHNIPEGISVAMPIYYATGSRKKALKYTLLSGIAEPVGALLAFALLRPFISDLLLGAIFAVVAGIMVYISLEELIPSSRQYGFDRLALLSTLTGVCLMPLSELFSL